MNKENPLLRIPHSARRETQKIREDTGTEINYAELTWSNRQILCDSLQNNLDAETRKFIAKLEKKHIPGAADHIERASVDPQWRESYLKTLHLLHTLAVRAHELDLIEKDRLVRKIHEGADKLGIDLYGIDTNHFKTSESPELPNLTYAVKDLETGKVVRNLSKDDILAGKYANSEKFPLFEWKVEDMGSGFDATKSVLYLPTKKGESFSRGMFGEGLKVNQAAIARTPGVNLRIHSQFEKEDGSSVAWVRHVYPEDNIVMQRGREVGKKVADSNGSSTTIRFVEAQDLNKELRETLDPRFTNVGEVAAEFGEHDFSYPLGITEDGFVQPGVALDISPSAQYLQGLRVGTSGGSLLFSYDFQNRNIIAGRDRNHLQSRVMRDTVKSFWSEVRDRTILREFLQRVVLSESDTSAPEREVLFASWNRLHRGQGTEQDAILFREFVNLLNLRSDLPNYIATRGDGRISQIDSDKTNIVQLKISCKEEESTLLRELLKQQCVDFLFITPVDIMPERQIAEQKPGAPEKEFTDKEQKFLDDLKVMYTDISVEMEPLDRMFYQPGYKRRIFQNIKFQRSEFALKVSFEVRAEANESNITCYIPSDGENDSSIPNLSESVIRQDFTAKLIELRLSSLMLEKGRFTSVDSSYHEYAQMSAQSLLDSLSAPLEQNLKINDSLKPLLKKALELQTEQLRGKEQKKIIETLTIELQSYERESYALECPPERILEIMQWCREQPELPGSDELREGLSNRVIVENGIATYIELYGPSEQLKRVELTTSNQVGIWNEYPEYQLDDERYIIPVDTKDRAVLKLLDGRMIAICGGLSVNINNEDDFVESGASSVENSIKMDRGCIISFHSFSDTERGYKFHVVPQDRDQNEAVVEVGIVKSPVTLEYISDHWSDPVRIFQDLGQNHMDAGGFEERFLVLEEGKGVWVSRDQLGYSEILGYELSDKGLGYGPSGIHTMGHTQKRNPFLTGKNGEGLKLAAASAKKQGFDISFASFGFNSNGTEVSWQAEAMTIPEEYTHDGKTSTAQRLVFDVQEKRRTVLEGRSAITQVMLPSDADKTCFERWYAWMDCVDPRNKDEYGNGGMNRYLLVTENAQGKSSTVGPTTMLLDRPGEIFENGTLIRAEQQAERKYTLGWNFPSISSTRERTHIDEDMAQAYIRHFFEHTTDEAAVAHLLKSIQVHEINDWDIRYAKGEEFSRIIEVADQSQEELDVNPDWALPDSNSYPSLALFQRKAQELYPDKMLFSYEMARSSNISLAGSMRHIRPENRLNVSEADYYTLRHIFPTMEDYMKDVQNSIIDIESDTLEPLRSVIGGEIVRVKEALDRLEHNPKTASMLEHVLKTSNCTREEVTERLNRLLPETAAGTAADVFLMADDSKADGLASTGIGLRVSLLEHVYGARAGRMYGVIDHELAHKMLDAQDYTTEFILLLNLLAQDQLRQRSIRKGIFELEKLSSFYLYQSPEEIIRSLRTVLDQDHIRLEDIGTTEHGLETLRINYYLSPASKLLKQIQVDEAPYGDILRLREILTVANLSITNLGISVEEWASLQQEGLKSYVSETLEWLHAGDRYDYREVISNLRSTIEKNGYTLHEFDISESELANLKIQNSKDVATMWLEYLRYDSPGSDSEHYIENLRQELETGNFDLDDIGTTKEELQQFGL